jgi:hypothetical protein
MSLNVGQCATGLTLSERTEIYNYIRLKFGASTLEVELIDADLEYSICDGIREYSTWVNRWTLQNRLGEMLGLPSDVDFTLKFISNSLYFERSFATSIAEQSGYGANSVKEYKTDYITLTGGVQTYLVPAGREIADVLWYTPSFINLFGLDPFANQNIAFSEFGASFAGHTLYHVMPVFDTIMTAQAAELRNRVRGSEYAYSIHGGPDGTKMVRLYPTPRIGQYGGNNNTGIGGGAGTPGSMFYRYYDRVGVAGNSAFSGNSANPSWTAETISNTIDGTTYTADEQGNGLVATPADANLDIINWEQLNSNAKQWVRKWALAEAAENLSFIRGKFDELVVPDASVKLNSDSLMSYAEKTKERLFKILDDDLEKLSYKSIMEDRASVQEAINKSLGYGPMGIWVY